MRPFLYERAATAESAVQSAGSPAPSAIQSSRQFIAGGTNLSDYMRLDVMRPEALIDLNGLDRDRLGSISLSDQGLRLGALVRMAEAEDHEGIRSRYPVIADTLKLAASRQIRNMASLGGNVLQRTRCAYFRETSWPCNKRTPGSGCSAIGGVNRQHAILGVSDSCIAAYPGDFAQALIALDATVDTLGPKGPRRLFFAELHRLPGNTPEIETVLEPGELITAIDVPAGPWTRRSLYLKVRGRDSFAFALASAAVALDMDGDVVRNARLALGGVATVPWRAREAEKILKGRLLDEAAAKAAADAAFAEAKPSGFSSFKLPLGKQSVVRALLEAKAMVI